MAGGRWSLRRHRYLNQNCGDDDDGNGHDDDNVGHGDGDEDDDDDGGDMSVFRCFSEAVLIIGSL